MAKEKDISATEKLLEIIRGDESAGDGLHLEIEKDADTPATNDTPGSELPPESEDSALLLDLDDGPEEAEPAASPTPVVLKTRKKSFSFNSLIRPLKNILTRSPVTVGIDIQPEALILSKTAANATRTTLLAYQYMPFKSGDVDSDTDSVFSFIEAEWFKEFLRKSLKKFCAFGPLPAIWCAIPTNFVEIRNILIPKVAKKDIANAVYWTAKKEADFQEGSVILDYSILGEIAVKEANKIVVMVMLAPRDKTEALQALFAGAGYPLAGVTTPVKAIQNQLQRGWLGAINGSAAHLHLDEQESFINIFLDGRLMFSRGIRTGINSLIDSLYEQAADQGGGSGIPLDEPLVKTGGDGEQQAIDLNLPATGRLLRQLDRTFDYCLSNYGIKRPDRLFVTTRFSTLSAPVIDHFGAELGIKCAIIDPFESGKLFLGGLVPPENGNHRQAMVTAIGLALSDNTRTKNFLFTYTDKARAAQIQKNNNIIISAFCVLGVVSGITYSFEKNTVRRKTRELTSLNQELKRRQPPGAGPSQLMNKAQKVAEIQRTRTAEAKRGYKVALIGEVIRNLPENVKLIGIRVSAAEAAGNSGSPGITMVVEGTAGSARRMMNMEFALAGFLRNLAASPMIKTSSITKKELMEYEGQNILHFILNITPEPPYPAPEEVKG